MNKNCPYYKDYLDDGSMRDLDIDAGDQKHPKPKLQVGFGDNLEYKVIYSYILYII